MKITLYDFPAKTGLDGWDSYSPFVLQASRALRFAGLEFEHAYANMVRLKELNPAGQLPVVVFGDEKVADSTRIMKRIEELKPGVFSKDLDARGKAEAWLWEELADTLLYPFVLASRWADDRGWHVPRDAFFGALPPVVRTIVASTIRRGTVKKLVERDFLRNGLDACYARMATALDDLDARAPSEGFWLGPNVTAADIGLFAQLHSLRMPVVEHTAAEVAKRKELTRYLDRVDEATRAATGSDRSRPD
ncbi:MAG: glutathione S-transferase N-terminal domain-containing protein [Labilithrix sp.]|nr:glutathione S-transferase N-terminal domain-containing protein [Labilithrix sp.]MCW5815741.1 glutathione S-transferase N-terminal domain-containing protein [Labilithrix sp.]